MKKIVMLSPKFTKYIGGMESHAFEFSDFFSQHPDFTLTKVITKECVDDGVEVKGSSNYQNGLFSISNVLTGDMLVDGEKILEELGSDCDILFMNSPNWTPCLDAVKKKFPALQIVVRSGGNDISAGWIGSENKNQLSLEDSRKVLVDSINNYVDVLISNSDYSTNLAISLGVNSSKIQKITGGVNCDRFVFSPNYTKPFRILSMCRFVVFKGIDKSLEVIKKLVDNGYNVIFEILGDGPQKDELKNKITQLKLENVVTFRGAYTYDEISNHCQNMTLLLHMARMQPRTSNGASYIHTETMGRVFCEAAALGLPCVATNVGGVSEVIEDTKTGFLVEQDDIESAVHKIKLLLDNQNMYEDMSKNARLKAQRDFTWKFLFEKYISLFNDK